VSPRACTVCTHPELEAINRALVQGLPNRRIASHHDVTERAVRNHKAGHLPAALAKAQEAREVAKADDLLSDVRGLQERALGILDKAETLVTCAQPWVLSGKREGISNSWPSSSES
jgi:hypothetical protein